MKTVFFSWQSDCQNENRNFIEKSIKNSLKSLEKDNSFELTLRLDKDTHGLTGSPDIMSSIYKKIDKCSLFIADISNVIGNKKNHLILMCFWKQDMQPKQLVGIV